jgi:hypothetical protein
MNRGRGIYRNEGPCGYVDGHSIEIVITEAYLRSRQQIPVGELRKQREKIETDQILPSCIFDLYSTSQFHYNNIRNDIKDHSR